MGEENRFFFYCNFFLFYFIFLVIMANFALLTTAHISQLHEQTKKKNIHDFLTAIFLTRFMDTNSG